MSFIFIAYLFWKSEFSNTWEKKKSKYLSIYKHRLHRCKRIYETLVTNIYRFCSFLSSNLYIRISETHKTSVWLRILNIHVYMVLVLYIVYTSCYVFIRSEASYGVNDFYPFIHFLLFFSFPQIIIPIFFIPISEGFVPVKRVDLFYQLVLNIFSLRTMTLQHLCRCNIYYMDFIISILYWTFNSYEKQ